MKEFVKISQKDNILQFNQNIESDQIQDIIYAI